MRLMSRTSRAARFAAIPLVAVAALSSACNDGSSATAPVRPVAVPTPPVSSSISADPILDIVTARTPKTRAAHISKAVAQLETTDH